MITNSLRYRLSLIAVEKAMDPSTSHTSQTVKANKNKSPQNLLSEARKKLKSEHAEATRAVVDPSAEKPPRLTGRQRAKHLKLLPTDDILATVAKTPFEKLTSSQQYLLKPSSFIVEPFYAQLEEIRRVEAQSKLLARFSHAKVNPQARR